VTPDVLGELTDRGPDGVPPVAERAAALVKGGGPIDLGRLDALAGQSGFEHVRLGPEAPDVEHGPRR
jgi:hypothetical protein